MMVIKGPCKANIVGSLNRFYVGVPNFLFIIPNRITQYYLNYLTDY